MKKAIKKFMAALLAAAMLCAMAVPAAFADGSASNGSITINGAIKGQTYKIYRILNLETNADYTAYKYTVNTGWEDFVSTHSDVFTVTNGVVTLADETITDNSAKIQALANAAGMYAENKGLSTDATASSDSKTVSGLPLGYYLVVSDPALSANSLCSLGTTKPHADINEKNGAPSVDKKVKENSKGDAENAFGKVNDADIGDTVTFQTTINVTDGNPTGYVLHDTMEHMTFTGVTSVTKNGADFTAYTVDTSPADKCNFDIVFDTTKISTNDVIVVTYTATINVDAVIGVNGNKNTTHLEYNNSPSVESTTTTYVWSMDILKYTQKSDSDPKTPLAGAEFRLSKTESGNTLYAKLHADGVTFESWVSNENDASTLVSGTDGKIAIKGIDAGTYTLTETKAPAGYNNLTNSITVVISNASDANKGTVSYTYDGKTNTGTVEVLNNTGATLPSTGGIGTTIFYVIGGGLMVAAIVLLVTKKRMENK